MKKKTFILSIALFVAFIIWTLLVCLVDVRDVGPCGTNVGFATLNSRFHSLTGVNWGLYVLTDWLGLVPFAVAGGFGVFGFIQLIRRRHILKVDRSILALGVFYIAVIAVYILFEIVHINYRPVLIHGNLEVSYPSSTTMLAISVMPAAMIELNSRIRHRTLRRCTSLLICAFTVFMVAGRLISGVHWVSDIIGGALLSTGLLLMYQAFREK